MDKKKILVFVLKLAITGLVFVWIDRTFGFPRIAETLAEADFRFFIAAILLHVISIVFGAWQWRIILKTAGFVLVKSRRLNFITRECSLTISYSEQLQATPLRWRLCTKRKKA